MLEQIRQAGVSNEVIEEALSEGAATLANSLDEAVPLHDYRVSVDAFFSALEFSLRLAGPVQLRGGIDPQST